MSLALTAAVLAATPSRAQITGDGDVLWTQNSPSVPGVSEAGDRFGEVLASGDFNGDGRDDLAIAVPFEDVDSRTEAGAVNVLYGAAKGLTGVGSQVWYSSLPGMPGTSFAIFERFGSGLTAGDFDGDGYDDLVITTRQSTVFVLRGSASGLGVDGADFFSGSHPAIDPAVSSLGYSLCSADFDADGRDDLVLKAALTYDIGVAAIPPFTPLHIFLRGTAGGLVVDETRQWLGLYGTGGLRREQSSLACADFNGDGYDDLATGSPDATCAACTPFHCAACSSGASPGAVEVLLGTATGIDTSRLDFVDSSSGFTMTTGDVDADGRADLAIGDPFANALGNDRGAVVVLYGDDGALRFRRRRGMTQSSSMPLELQETAEDFDRFGWSVAIGRFELDRSEDLAIGVPGEDRTPYGDVGLAHVVYGRESGLTDEDNAIFFPGQVQLAVTPQANADFGWSLATGDFDGNGLDELAVGIPGSNSDTGSVLVMRNSNVIFLDGFESGSTSAWAP